MFGIDCYTFFAIVRQFLVFAVESAIFHARVGRTSVY